MDTQVNQKIKIGDKVTFDNDKVEVFKAETNLDHKEIQQYRKLVLAGIDQIGIVKELGITMTTVSYPDGWDLPIPTKYLIVLPEV
jgi:3-isopropylmalate dehydratase small subunit